MLHQRPSERFPIWRHVFVKDNRAPALLRNRKYTGIMKAFRLSYLACLPEPCGEILFPYAAILSLHVLGGVMAPPIAFDETKEFQQIIGAKR
jgi:hypothetical protein